MELGPCILGPGSVNGAGYHSIWHKGKRLLAHRVAYCEHNGVSLESIAGLVVRHRCDNRRCINPKHLLIGTHKDNSRDMIERGRQVIPDRRREKNPAAKLTQALADQIKLATGTQTARAKRFGVSQTLVSQIDRGVAWC